jgi:hypothetical protein
MKIEPRRAPLAEVPALQDDSTAQFEARTEPTVYRRTTVTVERETLSVLVRRTVVAPEDELAGADSNPDGTQIEAGREPK